MKAWYVVQTKVRQEMWARSNLWERGLEVYLPLYRKERRHARRVDLVAMPLFPRYLFVEADFATGERRAVASAQGVERLVAFGDRPAALPPAVLAEIRGREGPDGYVALAEPGFRRGERVRIAEGALAEQVGLFDCADDGERVVVLLTLLGREVRVRVPGRALVPAG